ncbi:hypothetical protein O3P69_009219 [Scylla paramamosain]|uniref:Cuticle protein n=3 Tax=Scylla paramamosain TaxID=85552 RepID=A0AAW0TAF0_SCYPA
MAEPADHGTGVAGRHTPVMWHGYRAGRVLLIATTVSAFCPTGTAPRQGAPQPTLHFLGIALQWKEPTVCSISVIHLQEASCRFLLDGPDVCGTPLPGIAALYPRVNLLLVKTVAHPWECEWAWAVVEFARPSLLPDHRHNTAQHLKVKGIASWKHKAHAACLRHNTRQSSTISTSSTMKTFQVVIMAAAAVVLAAAAPRPDSPPKYGPPPPHYKEPGMPYDFAYAVKDDYTGNDFGQEESSDGHVTSGSYYVALPDGRVQKVSFTADHEGGYVADVTYEGEATYPAHPAPPAYGPPAPPAYGPPAPYA